MSTVEDGASAAAQHSVGPVAKKTRRSRHGIDLNPALILQGRFLRDNIERQPMKGSFVLILFQMEFSLEFFSLFSSILAYRKILKQQRKDYLEADEARFAIIHRKNTQRKQVELNRDMVKCKYFKIIWYISRYD